MKRWILLLFVLGFFSCDREAGEIPAYLRVPSVQLSTLPGQGAPSHRITDLWVYLEDEFHGAYPVGSDIPVLKEGPTPILIFPGVKMNGSNNFPQIYNMYDAYRDTVNFTAGEILEFPITFKYKESAFFPFVEDFEGPHRLNVDLDEYDTTRIVRTSEDVLWGTRAGVIELTKDAPLFKIGSDILFEDLYDPNRRIFVELDYKCDEPFFIGFRGNRNGLSPENLLDAVVNPKEDWNKIYFEFSNFVRGTRWDYYQLLIEGGWRFDGDSSKVSKIYLDNIKLTYLRP